MLQRKVAVTVEHMQPGIGTGVSPGTEQVMVAVPDGRRARWTEHRRARREELVGAAVEAVRRAGPDFAVDDVAREARVSKTVIYRYFSDKDELIDAVLEQISGAVLLPRLLGELAVDRTDDRARLRAVIGAFVALIEEEPALYRFAYARAGRTGRRDLVAATEREIAEALGVLMGQRLTEAGRPELPAMTWAYGVVGMIQLTAHWWAGTRSLPAGELVEQLADLA